MLISVLCGIVVAMISSANTDPASLTSLLHRWRDGDGAAYNAVIAQSYEALRKLAHSRVNRAGGEAGIAPTELLHEALIKVADAPKDWHSRAHFFASMSLTLRSVLVDFAREQQAAKRGGEYAMVTFTESSGEKNPTSHRGLLELEEALSEIEAADPRSGEILHLTYYADLTVEEVASVLNISAPTVYRELRFARGWLKDKLKEKLKA
jgi:RNA polymerase sigma factor (TIGR02999 family)